MCKFFYQIFCVLITAEKLEKESFLIDVLSSRPVVLHADDIRNSFVTCFLNDTHLMGPSSFVSCFVVICRGCVAQSVDAYACFNWCINAQLLSVSMALAANDLCISVVLWFRHLPSFVVTICDNKCMLHPPEVRCIFDYCQTNCIQC